MNSHALAVSSWFFASPLGKGERTKVRACTCVIASVHPHPTLSQTHSFALTGAGASVSPGGREKGDANVALIT